MFGSVVAQGQRGMRETVASGEQGARSREQGAKSEERRAKSEEQGRPRHSQDMVYACGSGHRIHFGYILLVVFISFQCFLRADIRPQKACARGVNLAKQKPTKPDVESFIDALHSHIPASQACA